MNHVALQMGHNRRGDDSRDDEEDSGLQGMEVEVDLNNEDMEEDEEELEESYSGTVNDGNKMRNDKKNDGNDCDEGNIKIPTLY